MRTIVVNGSKGLTVEIGAESLNYEELKETGETELLDPKDYGVTTQHPMV